MTLPVLDADPNEPEVPRQLVRVRGQQAKDTWILEPDRSTLVGRRGQGIPDIDLWPDRRVSTRQASIWFEDGAWWIEDLGSEHCTLVGGQEIERGRRTCLPPRAEIQIGETVLLLAPPHWHRLTVQSGRANRVMALVRTLAPSDWGSRRSRGVVVEVEVTPTVNFALAHCGLPVVSWLVVRNWGRKTSSPGKLVVSIPGYGHTNEIVIPALHPGQSRVLPPPEFQFDWQAVENQTERVTRTVAVRLDGRALQGDPIDCWILAHNEWSAARAHRLATAAFVLPNHPLVRTVADEATSQLRDRGNPAEVLGAIYNYFYNCHLGYCLEPPCFESHSQKVRLPHQVLLDFIRRRGEGTCIDLALLIAACLEYLRFQPLIAILDMGLWRHALVGCWRQVPMSQESLLHAKQPVLQEALWVEPLGCTRAPKQRMAFGPACDAAKSQLTQRPCLFVLDIGAARTVDEIRPLSFTGEPQWGEDAKKAAQAARACAETTPTQLSTVPLLLGLLSLEEGLTGQLVAARPGSIAQVRQKLPPGAPYPPSPNYENARTGAMRLAQTEDSLLVQESHLLLGLLATQSGPLNSALQDLGTTCDALLDKLRKIWLDFHPGLPFPIVFSQFPSQP